MTFLDFLLYVGLSVAFVLCCIGVGIAVGKILESIFREDYPEPPSGLIHEAIGEEKADLAREDVRCVVIVTLPRWKNEPASSLCGETLIDRLGQLAQSKAERQ